MYNSFIDIWEGSSMWDNTSKTGKHQKNKTTIQ